MTYTQLLLPEFDSEVKKTRQILERVPDDHLNFQPHPKSMALDRLATHVAELPSWPKMILSAEVTEIPADFKYEIAKSRAELLEHLDRHAAEGRAAIAAATEEDWAKTWTLFWGGQQVLKEDRIAITRSIVMNHLVHHRAQLGVYLRLLNVPIPGLYGPSADEQ